MTMLILIFEDFQYVFYFRVGFILLYFKLTFLGLEMYFGDDSDFFIRSTGQFCTISEDS